MNSTNRIESVFDAVMYQKGASVLRMLRAWTNRANRKAPLPTHETVPGTTYEQARGGGRGGGVALQACLSSTAQSLQQQAAALRAVCLSRHACPAFTV